MHKLIVTTAFALLCAAPAWADGIPHHEICSQGDCKGKDKKALDAFVDRLAKMQAYPNSFNVRSATLVHNDASGRDVACVRYDTANAFGGFTSGHTLVDEDGPVVGMVADMVFANFCID